MDCCFMKSDYQGDYHMLSDEVQDKVPEDVNDILQEYLDSVLHKGNKKCKNDVKYFFDNIRSIYDNDELIIKLNYDKKEEMMKDFKNHTNRFVNWLLHSKHNWNINKTSSFVPSRNGNVWVDYKFGTYDTRVFLYTKKCDKKRFKNYPDKKYMLIVRSVNEKLDMLYFGKDTEKLLTSCDNNLIIDDKKKKKVSLFRENKPLFTGETYNERYRLFKSTNPFE